MGSPKNRGKVWKKHQQGPKPLASLNEGILFGLSSSAAEITHSSLNT